MPTTWRTIRSSVGTNMADALLRVEHLSKRFAGVAALDDIGFEIGRGEIRCLIGENGSGKSTLIKVISGVHAPDEGAIVIDGREYAALTPIEAIRQGIEVIYQDFALFTNLTVAENIGINATIRAGKALVDWKSVYAAAREGLRRIGSDIPLGARVAWLCAADRQLIAIAKAILRDARLIIMDEPTTALTGREVRHLLRVIGDLQARGIAILFVSHKLDEIREIAQNVMIFRNGRKVLDDAGANLDTAAMAFHMTGRHVHAGAIHATAPADEGVPLLEVKDLTLSRAFRGVSLQLKRHEVLGITGLLGSGRTELARALFGEAPAERGSISIEGRAVRIDGITDAIAQQIGYVPEDRLTEGLFLDQSIDDNIVVGVIDRLVGSLPLLHRKKRTRTAREWLERLHITTPSGANPVGTLSGGNQQRVVLAKWLARDPRILILAGPTVGVDVGSKAEIHRLVRDLARRGIGIIVISDDIPELVHTCDRIILMRDGVIAREFRQQENRERELNAELIGGEPRPPVPERRGIDARVGQEPRKRSVLHTMIEKLTASREVVLLLILLALSLTVGIVNPAFFSFATLFEIARSSLVACIMGFGVLMVLISGGVDISFVALAAMSSYTTHALLMRLGYQGGIGGYFLVAIALGTAAGLSMGTLISFLRVPVFHVSIAALTLWYGFTLFFIGASQNFALPDRLVGYYANALFSVEDPIAGRTGLHVSVLYLVVIAIGMWFVLTYTVFGRGLYAIGNNATVAERSGYHVRRITLATFALVGAFAAIAGVTQSGYSRSFNPMLFYGRELDVLAAVIIGGAAVSGGQGSVSGTILGVVLIEVIGRSLIMVGITADWQTLVVGLVLVAFVSIPALRERHARSHAESG